MASGRDIVAALGYGLAAVLIIVGIVILVIPLILEQGVSRETGLTAIGFAIGGVIIAIIVAVFLSSRAIIK